MNERSRMSLRIIGKDDNRADLRFWLGKSAEERIDAMEFLREQYYALSGCESIPRLAHDVEIRKRRS